MNANGNEVMETHLEQREADISRRLLAVPGSSARRLVADAMLILIVVILCVGLAWVLHNEFTIIDHNRVTIEQNRQEIVKLTGVEANQGKEVDQLRLIQQAHAQALIELGQILQHSEEQDHTVNAQVKRFSDQLDQIAATLKQIQAHGR